MASSTSHSRSITSSILQHQNPVTATTAASSSTTSSSHNFLIRDIPTAFATRRSSRACIVPRPTRGVASPTGARVQNPSFTRRSLHSRRIRSGVGVSKDGTFSATSDASSLSANFKSADTRNHRGSSGGGSGGGRNNIHEYKQWMSYSTSTTLLDAATTSSLEPSSSENSNSKKNNLDINDISSSRGRNAVSLLPVYLTDARAVTKYDPIHAPNGALQLSVAENQMLEDVLVPAIRKFATATTTTTTSTSQEEEEGGGGGGGVEAIFHSDQIYYQPTHGRQSLRTAMSTYLHTILKLSKHQQLDIDGMVLGAGCNAVLENLCFCLTQPGDAVLIPTPYYAAFEFDLVARAGLNIIPVHTMKYNGIDVTTSTTTSTTTSATTTITNTTNTSTGNTIPQSSYYPNAKALNAAYELAKASGSQPKIVLLSHPNNPLGVCYPPSVMEECIRWAREKKVHLISDEIYAGSVYRKTNPLSGEDTFQSALRIASSTGEIDRGGKEEDNDGVGLGLGPYIHFVYALSKDFALSGLRVGVAYSENKAIRLPMQKLNDLCQISSQTQQTVETMLLAQTTTKVEGDNDDTDHKNNGLWATDEFLPQNNARIKARSDRVQLCLDDCNIPCLFGDSGLFLWMDFTEFLPPMTLDSTNATTTTLFKGESEESKDERERALYLELLQEYGLLFTPGRSMRNEFPGFFRFVFTAASDEEFDLGLERIKAYVDAKRSSV